MDISQLKPGDVIHVTSEEEAKQLFIVLKEHGYTWSSGYTLDPNKTSYGQDGSGDEWGYSIESSKKCICHSRIGWYSDRSGYTIIPFTAPISIKMQTITRAGLKAIHDVACSSWKRTIKAYAGRIDPLEDVLSIPNNEIEAMYSAADSSQMTVLNKFLHRPLKVVAKDMQIGQIAKIIEGSYEGKYIQCQFEGFVCVDEPNATWKDNCTLEVEIVKAGTKFTITAK